MSTSVQCWHNLLGFRSVFVRERKGVTIIRGLRAVSDYDYEAQMALIDTKNRGGGGNAHRAE